MRFFRRHLVLVCIATLVLGVLAAAAFQLTTRNALIRAEAFEFRRMLVSRQGEEGTFRFYFATNRRLEAGDAPLEERFANERDPGLRFGYFDTDIEPSLGIGMLVNPSDWFQNEEIRVLDVGLLDQEAFIEQLRAQMQAAPQRSVLVNVNGFRERFPSALRKTAFIAHVLDMDTPILVFDWPGDQGSTLRGYRRAQRIARESGVEFAQLARILVDEVAPEQLSLLANSMGGEVTVNAFSLLYEDAGFADPAAEFEDVVLTAPDVSHREFGEQFKGVLKALAREVTVYVSSNDRALLMSRVINRGRRLGESAGIRENPENPDQADEAAKVLELIEPGSSRFTAVDVTPVNRTRNFHNFSLETPEFFDDLFLRLRNPATPRSRRQYSLNTPDGKSYIVLTRGR